MARKILLADDSVTAQNMGRRILSDAGYEVTTVNNGSAALKKVAESKPDLIVLDVYMPGYGGLEVCQRLRESDDTARIPVLLTVGKLEPFKVEEVRRVRADAFIVKPFEASELLTALTKLEDKIVPVAQPRKPGRFPKPGATLDDFVGSGRQYGDTETGWKNRLRIPPPHLKGQPEFPEPEPDRPRDLQLNQDEKRERAQPEVQEKQVQTREVEARSAGNLPPDITADEIAAIQAAAAAFSAPPEVTPRPKVEVETPPAALKDERIAELEVMAARPSPSEEGQTEAASLAPNEVATTTPELSTPAETAATSQTCTPNESPAEVVAAATPESAPRPAAEQVVSEQGKLAEHEVAAVLASLQAVTGASDIAQDDEPFFATLAAATAREEFTGPRWIAAPVPLTEEESSLILEQEMQKALAAMSAMDAPPTEAMSGAAAAAVPPEKTEPVAQVPPAESTEAKPQEPPFVPAASCIDDRPISPQVADAVSSELPVAQPAASQPEAAYAAAASTGGAPTGETAVSIEAASPALSPSITPPVAEPVEPQPESELAAAWASWKQIRESVVSPQMASQIAEATASSSSVSEPAQASPTAETAATDDSAAEGDESEAIAGIVDTVLAELKPKLMQEIARKMAKGKKK